MSNKYALLFAIVLGVIVVDQWSKQLAVRYLRSPSDRDFRSEHYAPCTKRLKRCESLCRARAKDAQSSLVACNRICKRQDTRCRDELTPLYDRAKKAWKRKLVTLKSSPLCRRIEYPSAARPECVVIERYFHFTYRTNSGAAWGIFSTLDDSVRRPFFICITFIAILFIFYLFSFRLEAEHRLMIIALALILGGALGNFLDRLRLDYVIDFIEWFWKSRSGGLTWPTFNIADAAISIGVGLIAIELLIFPQEEYEDEEDSEEDSEEGEGTSQKTQAADETPSLSAGADAANAANDAAEDSVAASTAPAASGETPTPTDTPPTPAVSPVAGTSGTSGETAPAQPESTESGGDTAGATPSPAEEPASPKPEGGDENT